MLKTRVALLSLPIAFALGQAAMASSVTLTPLTPHTQVALSGTTCAKPQEDARITEPLLMYPLISQLAGREGSATVGIDLSAKGKVVRAWMVQSSDDVNLDRGALDTARESGYAPERQNCAAVAGSYLVNVDFAH